MSYQPVRMHKLLVVNGTAVLIVGPAVSIHRTTRSNITLVDFGNNLLLLVNAKHVELRENQDVRQQPGT
jgi:hypothetical protein